MKHFFTVLLLLSVYNASAQSLPTPITDSFKNSKISLDSVGIYVQEVSSPSDPVKPLISWQANQIMQPGSTMKLVTSYAALDFLGTAYTWKTSVYKTGHLEGDELHGDLILQGGGDPRL